MVNAKDTAGEVAVSLVTPPGSGGIAVIDVRGRGAGELVAGILVPKSSAPKGRADIRGKLEYRHVRDGESIVDEVIVRRVSRGATETVEINCHGGVVAASEIVRLLVEAGAVECAPGPWAERAAADAGLDRIQAEAARLLPLAQTRLAVRVLCDQLNGALSRAVRGLDLGSGDALEALRLLAGSVAFGLALTRPRRLALVGEPNVGKSTLFNALVGHNRTIVSPVPGTTRDFVNEFIALGGYPLEVIDTAGLRTRGGVVEMKGVEATWGIVSDADIIAVVLDGTGRMTARAKELVGTLLPKNPLLVLNKCDLPIRMNASGLSSGGEVCSTSGLTGSGLPELECAILRRLPDREQWPAGSPVVFTQEQCAGVNRAADDLAAGRIESARDELARLLGG